MIAINFQLLHAADAAIKVSATLDDLRQVLARVGTCDSLLVHFKVSAVRVDNMSHVRLR